MLKLAENANWVLYLINMRVLKVHFQKGKKDMTEFEKLMIEQFVLLNENFKNLIERGGIVGGVSPALSVEKQYTLFEWLQKWLETEHKANVKETVYKNDCGIFKNYVFSKPNYDKLLSTIKQEDIHALIQSVNYPRQRVTTYGLITAALRSAYRNDYLKKDITIGLRKPQHENKEDRALTHFEEQRLLKRLKGFELETFIKVLLFAGLRRNEALGLQRKHIDFENNELHIEQQVNLKNEFTTCLKTKTSKRTIKIFPELKAELLQFKFCAPEIRLFDFKPDYVTRHFSEFCKSINIPDFTIKSCRTTFATRCEEKGIPDIIIQAWLGHSSIKTTKKHYVKVNSEFIEAEYLKAINMKKI